ncbi:MAG: DUF1028 domain-containing protein [Mycobacteriales bacterium]
MSIAGWDSASGNVGVAVASAQVSPGLRVLHAEPGVGAVAAQAESDLDFGRTILASLATGKSSATALRDLLAGVDGSRVQFGVVDSDGSVAAHTGAACQGYAGHAVADGACAQANMMATGGEWNAMLDAFLTTTGTLARRLRAGLVAGGEAGGDIRGEQGAALLVVSPLRGDRFTAWWWDSNLGLRVDDHDSPVIELGRLLDANHDQNLTAQALHDSKGDLIAALPALRRAAALAPSDANVHYCLAIVLIDLGRLAEAGSISAARLAEVRTWTCA